MKIRKTDDRPMVIHTKKKPRLHLHTGKKPVVRKKAGNTSVTVKKKAVFRYQGKAYRVREVGQGP